jgi:Amt family ammonium transporter
MSSPVARAVRTMEDDLRDALVAGDLVLRYQPIVDLATGRPVAVEAFCRWQHWSRGLLGPADFLPVAEETGLIVPLGEWVLHEACRRLGLWGRRLPEAAHLRVTVNLSAAELQDADLPDRAAWALAAAGLPADQLLVEVSEAVAYAGPQDVTARNLGALAALGVGLAVDGIGAPIPGRRSGKPDPGSWLWTLPIRLLKIDRGVAARLDERTLGSALRLAADRRIPAVAKGIETADQLSRLYRLGCPAGQGFLFARPLDFADAEAYLRRLPGARSWLRAAAG